MTTSAVATAWAALWAQDQGMVSRSVGHLTPTALHQLTEGLRKHAQLTDKECYQVIGHASLRQQVFGCLEKFKSGHRLASDEIMEEALQHHVLPHELQQELVDAYGGDPPSTWMEALKQLEKKCNNDKAELWRLILDHPMTAYVPVQCQSCGHVVPDDTNRQQTDEDLGLSEVSASGNELELRAGWFRGPRPSVQFKLDCPECGHISYWYRSGHPRVILNPNKWGRLCGEQEDLRLSLARYLDIRLRLVVPLDWDHIWSEYNSDTSEGDGRWQVEDDSARNFACRLDEGIGSWTRVLAIGPTPELCGDVTSAYLSCEEDGGMAEDFHEPNMPRYKQLVQTAREDKTGTTTQAKTVYGYVLGSMDEQDITDILQHAAEDVQTPSGKAWWHI